MDKSCHTFHELATFKNEAKKLKSAQKKGMEKNWMNKNAIKNTNIIDLRADRSVKAVMINKEIHSLYYVD